MAPLLPLTPAQASGCLAAAFPEAEVAAVTPLTSGHQNSNYRVSFRQDAPEVVLRVHARGPGVARVERAAMDLGRVAAPVPALFSREVRSTFEGRPVSAQQLLPGETLEAWLARDPPAADSARVGARLGRMLADLGRVALPRAGFFAIEEGGGLQIEDAPAPGGVHPYVAFALARLAKPAIRALMPAGELAALTDFLARAEAYLPDFAAPAVLGHGDFKPANLLVDDRPDGPVVSGLIDWEYAWAAPRLSDLATMMRWDDELPPGLVAAMLTEYQAGAGPLPPDWRRRLALADLIAQVDFLDRGAGRPAVVADARDRIARTLASWDGWPA